MPDAPTPTPSAPAAPPSAPTPAPAPAPSPAPSAPSDKFSDLDSKASAKKSTPPPKTPDAPAAPDKSTAPPTPEKPAKQPTELKDPKQLREHLANVQKERDSSTAKVAELQSKIADYESKGRDTAALSEQLAREQKEKETLQAQIRALKRETSDEFKKQYDRPFDQAAEYAKQVVEQLVVTNEDNTTRAAKWDDFVQLYSLPFNKAIAVAKDMFGDAAQSVMSHITELHRLDFQRKEALKEEQKKWKENEEKEIADAAREREFISGTWSKVNQDIAERHPEWYAEDPKDPEGNELLKEGFALVDGKPATVQEKIIRDAHIRLKAAAFPRLVQRNMRLQEEVEALKTQLAERDASTPGGKAPAKPSSGSSEGKSPATKNWKEDLREAMS